jgi:hypothetical protein
MPYYPSSQVKTNQHTNGSEFTLNGRSYVGKYFENSRGEFFSGATPQAADVTKLYPIKGSINNEDPTFLTRTEILNNQNREKDTISSYYDVDLDYWKAKGLDYRNPPKAPIKPIGQQPTPTLSDYEIGEFNRYFLKKNNELQYTEVNEEQLNLYANRNGKVQWQLYTPITISWVLEGDLNDVFNTNKNIVKLSETRNKLLGFVNIFRDRFAQYYKSEGKTQPKIKTSTKMSGGY